MPKKLRKKDKTKSDKRVRHRAYSLEKKVREGSLDLRTKEGYFCRQIKKMVLDDLGGPSNLSNRQWILLDIILIPKLIFYHQIAEWNLKHGKIVDEKGKLTSSLANNFLSFGAELRRDLEKLYSWGDNPHLDERVKIAQMMQDIAANKQEEK